MIQISFKGAVLFKNNSKLKIINLNIKDELKRGQVLVKLKYSGICGKQIDEIEGIGGKDKFLPHLLGHEGSGIVLKVGPGVKKIKPKDKVVLHWIKGSGIESSTPTYYSDNGLKINAGWITTFNEFAIVSENRITKIKSKYSLKKAALFGCCATTSLSLVLNKLNLNKNYKLLVVGIGGLGQVIIQGSNLFKTRSITAIDINKDALKKAKKFGAKFTYNFSNLKDKKILKDLRFNKIVVTTGNIKVINFCLKLLEHPGNFYILGVPKRNINLKTNAWNLMHDQIIQGSLGGGANPDKDINKFIELDKKRKINLNKIIIKTLNFSEINKGIHIFKNMNNSGRLLLKFK